MQVPNRHIKSVILPALYNGQCSLHFEKVLANHESYTINNIIFGFKEKKIVDKALSLIVKSVFHILEPQGGNPQKKI